MKRTQAAELVPVRRLIQAPKVNADALMRTALEPAAARVNIPDARTSVISAGWSNTTLNLDAPAPKALPAGVGLFLDGSAPPATQLQVRLAGGQLVSMRPGCRVRLRFAGGTVESWSGSGIVSLLVFQDEAADVAYFAADGAGNGLSRTVTTPATSSLLNIPANPSDGVDLSGANGARAILVADAGQTVTAALLVWWVFDPALGLWAEGPVQDSPATGRRAVAGADQLVGVPYGRAFAEARSCTVSSGALTLITQAL